MWGPKFTHNISLFYPEAILHYFGVTPANPYYKLLLTRVTNLIEIEVVRTAKILNNRVKQAFRKDLLDIDEYMMLGDYWTTLELALSSPLHIGVVWSAKLAQAKFIDTNILGGLKELQEIQHEVYPEGSGNLGAWASLYNRWLRGEDDRIGRTLQDRLTIMISRGSAPFAELIETGNDMYPAYPTHAGKHTLRDFKPVYNREMSAAYHRVVSSTEAIIATIPSTNLIPAVVGIGALTKVGFTWVARSGNVVFVLGNSVKFLNNRFIGSGFFLSPSGEVIKSWHGWLPR